MVSKGVVLGLTVASLSAPFALEAASQYSLTVLNNWGIVYSAAPGVNNKGQVVGSYATETNGNHPYLYYQGTFTDLGTLGGPNSSAATAITDSGQIVGWAQITGGSTSHAFLYENGTMTDLGILEGALASFGHGISEDGSTIVGSCIVPSHAFLYSGGQMVDLNSLIPTNSGWVLTDAYSVNNSGQIVGYGTIGGATHAYVYSNGLVTDLGTFGGSTSYAYHINNSGQIVGGAYTTNGIQHAFLYTNGVMTDLIPLGGLSYAYGINNHGDIVGRNDQGAFLYSGGVITDLNTVIDPNSGWTLPMAAAISDNGHIVGYAGTSSYFGFLLTPRPVLLNFRFASGGPAFDLQGMTGFTYRVEYSGSLPAGNWLVLTNVVLPSSPFSIVDTTAPASGQRFYRAVLPQ